MAPFFWEIAWAKALYEEIASAQTGPNYCTVFTYPFQDNIYLFATNGGASGGVAPGLMWLEQDIFTWDKPNYDCPYPPSSGVWYQLKPELPDGTVFPTGSSIVATPRAAETSTSMRFIWWETGVAVGYGDTLEEAQANAAAQVP